MAILVFPRDRDKGERIAQALEDCYQSTVVLYEKERMKRLLEKYDLLLAVMAVGIVTRSLCRHLQDKWQDKPVVAVDSALSCAVPVVGGHHGANDLAQCLADRLGLYPAITTATDASGRPCLEKVAMRLKADIVNRSSSKSINLAFLNEDVPIIRLKGPKILLVDDDVAVLKSKGLVLGVGTRKGVSSEEVLQAVDQGLKELGKKREDIAFLATAWLKKEEEGLIEAAGALDKEIVFLSREDLNSQEPITPSRAEDLGLVGVAEPAVLALAKRLILSKKAYGRVTIAIGE